MRSLDVCVRINCRQKCSSGVGSFLRNFASRLLPTIAHICHALVAWHQVRPPAIVVAAAAAGHDVLVAQRTPLRRGREARGRPAAGVHVPLAEEVVLRCHLRAARAALVVGLAVALVCEINEIFLGFGQLSYPRSQPKKIEGATAIALSMWYRIWPCV